MMKLVGNRGTAAMICVSVVVLAAFTADAARGTAARCPAGALVLSADGSARAARAAVAAAASDYPHLKTAGAKVVSAKRATAAGPRGAQVGIECGAKTRARTVVVELRFPRMAPSASLSQGVVDVSRFANGYRVWAVVH
jgi:hypothetical protein